MSHKIQNLVFSPDVPVLIQGASGRMGTRHMALMEKYGTNIVGGIGGGREPGELNGVTLYRSCREAVEEASAYATVMLVPPLGVLAAVREAAEAGLKLIVSPAEGMPIHDALEALEICQDHDAIWVGPSTPGIAIPNRTKLGFIPDVSLLPGPLGVMSKSGTLSYEVCYRLSRCGVGQSVWIGVGGDMVKGLRFSDLVLFFQTHDETKAVLVIGEIGGTEEEELAQAIKETGFDKPVYVILAGASARAGVTMGHAGALMLGDRGTISSKRKALEQVGAMVFSTITELVDHVSKAMGQHETE